MGESDATVTRARERTAHGRADTPTAPLEVDAPARVQAIVRPGAALTSVDPADVEALQRLAGNAAVVDFLEPRPHGREGHALGGIDEGLAPRRGAPVQRSPIDASAPREASAPDERSPTVPAPRGETRDAFAARMAQVVLAWRNTPAPRSSTVPAERGEPGEAGEPGVPAAAAVVAGEETTPGSGPSKSPAAVLGEAVAGPAGAAIAEATAAVAADAAVRSAAEESAIAEEPAAGEAEATTRSPAEETAIADVEERRRSAAEETAIAHAIEASEATAAARPAAEGPAIAEVTAAAPAERRTPSPVGELGRAVAGLAGAAIGEALGRRTPAPPQDETMAARMGRAVAGPAGAAIGGALGAEAPAVREVGEPMAGPLGAPAAPIGPESGNGAAAGRVIAGPAGAAIGRALGRTTPAPPQDETMAARMGRSVAGPAGAAIGRALGAAAPAVRRVGEPPAGTLGASADATETEPGASETEPGASEASRLSRASPADPSVQVSTPPAEPHPSGDGQRPRLRAMPPSATPEPPRLARGFKEKRPGAGAVAGAGPGGAASPAEAQAPTMTAPAAGAAAGPGGAAAGPGGGGPRAGAGGPRARAGGPRPGGGGPGPGGGGAGRGAAPRPSLGDASLEAWRSASSAAIEATEAGDLGEAKEGPSKLEAEGEQIDSDRKAAQPDYEADAKSGQPPMPEEPEKDAVLDTGPAEAAVDAVIQAGEKRLSEQRFDPLGAPPPYPGLNPRDFVPKTLLDKIADLEKRLVGEGLSPGDKAKMTAQLEALKEHVATIEQKAAEGTPVQEPPTVVDEGPSKLTPPDPAMGDLLGDVVARELGRVGERSDSIVKGAVAQVKGTQVPRMLEMGDEEKPTLESELRRELEGIAEAAGVTEEQLKSKIVEQKDAVKAEADAVEEGLAASSAAAKKKVEERGQDEAKSVAGAKEAVEAEIAQKQEAVSGPPDTEAIERKRDEFLGKVEQAGAQALAGIKSSLSKREEGLDAAGTKQKTAAAGAAKTQADAIRRHWSEDPDPDKGMVEARPTTDWGRTRSAAVDTEVRGKKTASKAEADAISDAISRTVADSRDKVRDWAAGQEGRERSWWERLWDMIVDWGRQAEATNEAWEKQRNADTRDKMAADFDTLTRLREAQVTQKGEAVAKELGNMDAEQRKLAETYLKGGISSVEFVAQSTIGRIRKRRTPELATTLEERAIAEWGWEDLGQLARGSNPGFDPAGLANKVRGGVAGLGTNEGQVYEGLGGARTAVERAALAKCYEATFGVSMDEDVDDDMDDHEYERAKALMEGKSSEADAAAIKEALEGLGTDEDAVRNALRGKTPEELEAIKAEYLRKYGVPLEADLEDDMEDAELDNALALAEGDLDRADAAELEDAMSGPGTDEEKLKKVYERIRQEEEERARREGLTPAELQARIQERNSRLKTAFNAKYGDLETKMTAELADVDESSVDRLKERGSPIVDTADVKLMQALQEGDTSKIDAAKALVEHESIYASDDELEAITRNQHKKADLEVNLELAAEKARLKAAFEAGDITLEDYKERSLGWDARYKERDKAVKAKAQENMGELKDAYSKATHGTQTFDQLILQETSGFSQLEIQDLVAAGGALDPEQELYYATAGVGTDEDKIKEVLKGKTPAEIKKIREAYAKKHPGRSLDEDILGDLSGREDLDIGHTLQFGDPETFAQQLAEAGSPEERQRILANMRTVLSQRKAFEETGAIGSIFAAGADPMNSAAQMERAFERAEAYDRALADHEAKNAGKKPEDMEPDPALTAARANFEMNFSGALEAQEQVRAQIDAYADVAAQVGAAIAGIAVTVATFGTAGPVVAAVYGAMAAAASTMYLKATLKGAAYGWEDAGVDFAVGAVDAAVSAATAGIGKGVMQALEKAIMKQLAKQAAKEGAEEVTESVMKAWLKEAMEEVIEGAVQGAPSAMVESLLNGGSWDNAIDAGLQGAAMGGAMGVGMKGAIDVGSAGIGAIKGKLKGEPRVEVGAPEPGGATKPPPETDVEPPPVVTPDGPEGQVDLPPQADPDLAAAAAAKGELPPGVTDADVTARQKPETEVGAPKSGEPARGTDPSAGKPDAEAKPSRPAEPGKPPPTAREGGFGSTPVKPDVAAGKPRPDDVGKPLTPDDLATRYGMPRENVARISAVAEAEGVIIDIRPTTPHAAPLLEAGAALPKPEKIKAKTINELDVQLGLAKPDDLGKVGFFEPGKVTYPEDFDTLPPDVQERLKAREKQRAEEWADLQGDMAELLDKGLIEITPDGLIINKGLEPGGQLPFTGDHDVFDIRNRDGTALTPERYAEVRQRLINADAGVEHGSVTGWRADAPGSFETAAGKRSYERMVDAHSPGGDQPLVRIGEGEPKAVWYDPAPPPSSSERLFSDMEIEFLLRDMEARLTGEPRPPAPEGPGSPKGGTEGGPPGTRPGGGDLPPARATEPAPGEEIITDWPEGSAAQLDGASAMDADANRELFGRWMESDPGREVGLLRNETTGEYIVVQGGPGHVDLWADNPRWYEDLLTPEQRAAGDWRYVAHSHPVKPGSQVTPEEARWPSGGRTGGDFNSIAQRAQRTGRLESSEIHYRTEEGTESLVFGYDPDADRPYFIERPGPHGSRVRHDFRTIEEYHDFYRRMHGSDLGAIDPAFPGQRELDVETTQEMEVPGHLADDEPVTVRRPAPGAAGNGSGPAGMGTAIPPGQYEGPPHLARGNLGERLATETLSHHGHTVLEYKPDIMGTNQGGFDLVTMKDGVVWIVDNKALTSRGTVGSASALTTNFAANLAALRDRLALAAADAARPATERAIWVQALAALDAGSYVKVITNANVAPDARLRLQAVSRTLRIVHDIHFADVFAEDLVLQ